MASSPYAISHVHTSAQTLLLTCLQTAYDPALQTSTVGDDTVRDDACAGIHGLGPSPVAHQVVVWRMCRGSHRVQHGAKLRHDVLTVSRHVATVGIMIQWGDLVVLCGELWGAEETLYSAPNLFKYFRTAPVPMFPQSHGW